MRRLCNLTLLGEVISPRSSMQRVIEILLVPFQRQSVYVRGATVRMEQTSDDFLKDHEANN